MKNFKNTSSIAGQSSTNLASPTIRGQKHDANLQKNSTLYFQVGLIICLLVIYGLLEMQFEKTLPSMDRVERIDEKQTTDVPAKVGDIVIIDEPVIVDEIFDMTGVEKVPIYPGCESAKTNDERRKCMSEKLAILIQKRFDKDLASELGLSGRQKINVQFKIDAYGKVTDIKTRAPRRELENEAKRVTEKIPQMIPGKQRDKAVSVLYNLPIVFDVQN